MTSSLLLLLQLQLPSSAAVEGNVCWNPKNNTDFDYQARGKLRVERQQCQVSKTQLRTLIIACLKGQYVRFGQLSNPYSEHKVGSISPKKLLTAANCSCCFMNLNGFFLNSFLAFCTAQWNIKQSCSLFLSQSSLQIKDSQNVRGGPLLCVVKSFNLVVSKTFEIKFKLLCCLAVFIMLRSEPRQTFLQRPVEEVAQ